MEFRVHQEVGEIFSLEEAVKGTICFSPTEFHEGISYFTGSERLELRVQGTSFFSLAVLGESEAPQFYSVFFEALVFFVYHTFI